MNKKVLLAGLAVTLPLIALLALSFGRDPHAVRSPLVGRMAPPFELTPVGRPGTVVSLASLRGKPVIVNFWATWCVPCMQEHGVLTKGARQFGDKVQFVGVVYEDKEETILEFLAKHGSGYQTLIDQGGKTAIAYGVGGVPETFFLDEQGRIVGKYNGPLSMRTLGQYVEQLTGGGS